MGREFGGTIHQQGPGREAVCRPAAVEKVHPVLTESEDSNGFREKEC